MSTSRALEKTANNITLSLTRKSPNAKTTARLISLVAEAPAEVDVAASGGQVERSPVVAVPRVDVRSVAHEQLHHFRKVVQTTLHAGSY